MQDTDRPEAISALGSRQKGLHHGKKSTCGHRHLHHRRSRTGAQRLWRRP